MLQSVGRLKLATGASATFCLLLLYRLFAVLVQGLRTPTTFDDAYVFCRYAEHLLAGQGLAWNPGGPQTYGVTSLLYTLWIAVLGGAFGFSSCYRLLAVGAWIPILLALAVTGVACARVARHAVLSRPLVGLGFVAISTTFQPGLFYNVKTGMDTTTAILTNALLILCVVDPRFPCSGRRIALAGGAAYLAFLARPDNLLYALLLPTLALALNPSAAPRRWRNIGIFGAVITGLLIVDTAVKTVTFGVPLPLSYYAKTGLFYEGYTAAKNWNPFVYTRYFLLNQTLPLLLLVVGVGRRSWRLVAALLLPCLVTFGYLATVTQIMGYEARLYFPSLPFWIVAAYYVLDDRLNAKRASSKGFSMRTLLPPLAALAVTAAVLFPAGDRAAAWYEARSRRLHTNQLQASRYRPQSTVPRLPRADVLEAISGMLRECPQGVVWAMSEHGFVSASAPDVAIVDLAGLHDRNTLAGKPIVEHLFEEQPAVIWFPHRQYTGMVNGLLTHPSFAETYDFWPRAFNLGLAVRKDSHYRGEIDACLRRQWRISYDGALPPPAQRVQ